MNINNIINITLASVPVAKESNIFKDLGLEVDSLIFYTICFLVTFGVVFYLLFKPVSKLIIERMEQINSNITNQEMLNKQLIEVNTKREDLKQELYAEKGKIIEEAKQEAKDTQAIIIANAHTEAQKIMEQTNQEVTRIKESIRAEVEKDVLIYYKSIIKKNLSQLKVLDEDINNQVIKELLK
jgi:F-type H+-transporting ATPase subunit b